MKLLNRFKGLLRRRQRAKRMGFAYSRDRLWETPQEMRIAGRMVELSLPNDQGTRIAFRDIFLEDVYGLLTFGDKPRKILDIGGHAGLFSLYARALFPDAVIHSYEPNPALKKCLQHQSEIARFTPFDEAVAGIASRARLSMGADLVFTRTIPDPGGDIRVISIEEAINRLGGPVDILKLDCEGCEWPILERRDALETVRFVTMEYHLSDGRTLSGMRRLVREAGFSIAYFQEDAQNNGRIWGRR